MNVTNMIRETSYERGCEMSHSVYTQMQVGAVRNVKATSVYILYEGAGISSCLSRLV